MKRVPHSMAFLIMLASTFIPTESLFAQRKFPVNKKESTIKWTGYHIAKSYKHWGNVSIKSGSFNIEAGEVKSGEVVADLRTLTCGDIEEKSKSQKLINDLMSEKFFHVNEYPMATIKINSTEQSESGGSTAYADITIRGITQPINFEIIPLDHNSKQYVYQAIFNVNRTKHEIMYGWSIDNVIIGDEFKLETKIVIDK